MNGVITYDHPLSRGILDMFGMWVDEEGYIICHDGKRAKAFNGQEFKLEEFAGIMKGKNGEVLFLLSDLPSLIELSDMLKERK